MFPGNQIHTLGVGHWNCTTIFCFQEFWKDPEFNIEHADGMMSPANESGSAESGKPSPSTPFIFNGDFVDRGSWSIEARPLGCTKNTWWSWMEWPVGGFKICHTYIIYVINLWVVSHWQHQIPLSQSQRLFTWWSPQEVRVLRTSCLTSKAYKAQDTTSKKAGHSFGRSTAIEWLQVL